MKTAVKLMKAAMELMKAAFELMKASVELNEEAIGREKAEVELAKEGVVLKDRGRKSGTSTAVVSPKCHTLLLWRPNQLGSLV